MSLAKNLNLKAGMQVRVVGKPAGVDLDDIATAASPDADAVLVFVTTLAEVDATCAPALEVARQDGLAWIAYPKARQLGTDLNRDVLWQHLLPQGVQGVRQISIDATWSAMRFRPKK
jgi:hypothetical protein